MTEMNSTRTLYFAQHQRSDQESAKDEKNLNAKESTPPFEQG
jgi:hypothetical protein